MNVFRKRNFVEYGAFVSGVRMKRVCTLGHVNAMVMRSIHAVTKLPAAVVADRYALCQRLHKTVMAPLLVVQIDGYH